jgi:peptidoglycan glycosyltransferase
MASYPSFDPNAYATFDGNKLNKIDARYRNDPNQPLLNRAINASYPPGSTFKIVTSSTALGTGRYTPNTLVYAPTVLKLPQTTNTLINSNGEICGSGSGQVPLIGAFTQSCNTAFGALGMKLGAAALKQQADKFGFNNAGLMIPMPVSPSNYVAPPSQALTAYSAIGQFSDTVTPMQEAMLSAAIANGGRLMKPYLVQDVKAPDLTTVQQATPSLLGQPVSAATAGAVKTMMLSVVNSPAGTAYGVPGIHAPGLDIAGKTGTAQNQANNTGLNDAVFTAFAPASNPQIAVGVIIKGGGYGAAAAAPIAVQVIQAYLAYLHLGGRG